MPHVQNFSFSVYLFIWMSFMIKLNIFLTWFSVYLVESIQEIHILSMLEVIFEFFKLCYECMMNEKLLENYSQLLAGKSQPLSLGDKTKCDILFLMSGSMVKTEIDKRHYTVDGVIIVSVCYCLFISYYMSLNFSLFHCFL